MTPLDRAVTDVLYDKKRLEVLKNYEIVDTEAESEFDAITALLARICDVPIAMITFVDETKVWVKSIVGFTISEEDVENSLCPLAMARGGFVHIPDTTRDIISKQHPYVVGEPHLRFYAGAPLMSPEAKVMGMICVLDFKPRTLTRDQRMIVSEYAQQVMTLLGQRLEPKRARNSKTIVAGKSLLKDSNEVSTLLDVFKNLRKNFKTVMSEFDAYCELSTQEKLGKEADNYADYRNKLNDNILLFGNTLEALEVLSTRYQRALTENYASYSLQSLAQSFLNCFQAKLSFVPVGSRFSNDVTVLLRKAVWDKKTEIIGNLFFILAGVVKFLPRVIVSYSAPSQMLSFNFIHEEANNINNASFTPAENIFAERCRHFAASASDDRGAAATLCDGTIMTIEDLKFSIDSIAFIAAANGLSLAYHIAEERLSLGFFMGNRIARGHFDGATAYREDEPQKPTELYK